MRRSIIPSCHDMYTINSECWRRRRCGLYIDGRYADALNSTPRLSDLHSFECTHEPRAQLQSLLFMIYWYQQVTTPIMQGASRRVGTPDWYISTPFTCSSPHAPNLSMQTPIFEFARIYLIERSVVHPTFSLPMFNDPCPS